MKVVQTLLLFSLSLLFLSCDEEDKETLDFNVRVLQQTRWTGTLK